MSLNDTSVGIGDTKGVDIPAGVANPTPASVYGNPQKDNYVQEPDAPQTEAGSNDGLGQSAESTIDSTKIEPIGTNPGQAGATGTSSSSSGPGIVEQVTDAAKAALDSVTGSK